jgi:hypothetical protein
MCSDSVCDVVFGVVASKFVIGFAVCGCITSLWVASVLKYRGGSLCIPRSDTVVPRSASSLPAFPEWDCVHTILCCAAHRVHAFARQGLASYVSLCMLDTLVWSVGHCSLH